MFIKSNDNEMNLHDMITKNESLKWYLMTVILSSFENLSWSYPFHQYITMNHSSVQLFEHNGALNLFSHH